MSNDDSTTTDFTPAAGYRWLTPWYDIGIALLTRERLWRDALLLQLDPQPDDCIVDVGCGTGSLLLLTARKVPRAKLLGIDPDREILDRARTKTLRAGVTVLWKHGYLRDVADLVGDGSVDKMVSSLVLHQVSLDEKIAGIAAMHRALRVGGQLHIADYGLQRSTLMRTLFRWTVQRLDGLTNTEPNARGVLAQLLRDAGFVEVDERQVIATLTGSISLYAARRG